MGTRALASVNTNTPIPTFISVNPYSAFAAPHFPAVET
jgi:hypothetical protein